MNEKEIIINGHIVRIYWLNTENFSDEVFQYYYNRLSPARRRKAGGYRFKKDRRLSVGAGMLLGKGLSYYGLEESGVQLSYNENGKPFLLDFPEIHFNLSHSETMVFAVFTDTRTGCDIEKIKQADLEVARRFFCPGEYNYIAGQKSEKEQQEAFCHLWTLKESFIKAAGAGLAIPLNSFEIKINKKDVGQGNITKTGFGNNNLDITILQNTDNAQYFFHGYMDNGYCAAVCLQA